MTVHRQNRLPVLELMPVLESNGWDVHGEDTLQAELGNAAGRFRLVIDKSGRVMLRHTALVDHQPGQTVHIHDRTYAMQTESFRVTHITTNITQVAEFPQILSDMMNLILAPDSTDNTPRKQ